MNLDEYRILKNDDYTYRDISPKLHEGKLKGYNNAFDVDAIKNSLMNIFLVQKGEVPGKPQFGNPLQLDLFDTFDYFSESSMKTAIQVEVEKYEPRAEVTEILINLMEEYNRIIIEVRYKINLKENNIEDSIYLPFSANDFSYLSGRTTTTI
jgi:phage baseplate assembly protein W